jgi:triosephosphate isomerase (TIM)
MTAPLIVGNWKMNPQKEEDAVNIALAGDKDNVVLCPPFVFLTKVKNTLKKAHIGAQNCFFEEEGAFTGEISPKMLKGLGCEYVILGHSERRSIFKEDFASIRKKTEKVVKHKMTPIICVGEKEEEGACDYIKEQLLAVLTENLVKKTIIAYEPVFAIGTGKPCKVEDAEKRKVFIKSVLVKNFKKGENTPILYGGSVNSQNASSYVKKAGFDGLLVGGASVKPKEFAKIIENTHLT